MQDFSDDPKIYRQGSKNNEEYPWLVLDRQTIFFLLFGLVKTLAA